MLVMVSGVTGQVPVFNVAEDWAETSRYSGGPVGFTDVDNNGWDDLIILDEGKNLVVYFQDADGFEAHVIGPVGPELQWCAAVGDVDNDGAKDLVSGGVYGGVHVVRLGPDGVADFGALPQDQMFMQGLTLVDLDADGVLDVFACDDDAVSRLWRGVQGALPEQASELMPLTAYDPGGYVDTDHSGNYSVVAADIDGDGDLDVHIAKCRQFVADPFDPRRVNQLWINHGDGNWTEEAAVRGVVLNEQSWTADFGDIDSDGDLDLMVTNHSTTISLLQNDGSGHFTDITAGSGLEVIGLFLQAKLADLNNDGHLDLLTAGNALANHCFLGAGDGTFQAIPMPMDTEEDAILSFAIGDVGRDGTLDVYVSRGGVYVNPDMFHPDQLHLNEGNGNHWVAFDLQGVLGNLDAVGARISLYGPWGVQTREVRAGESYGITCSHHVHFGLGDATAIDSAVVRFAGGWTEVLVGPAVDVYHEVLEAPCSLGTVPVLATDTMLCPGDEQVLSAGEAGQWVHWNTGDTTSSIAVLNPGIYRALVTDGEGCAGLTPPIRVQSSVVERPAVSYEGPLMGCEGSEVTLMSDAVGEWSWSNGAVSAAITVSENGAFHVTSVDVCGQVHSSDTLIVERFAPPEAPQLEDVVVQMPASVELGPAGEGSHWFADAFSTVPLGVGASWTTPMLDSTTTFWVERTQLNGTESATGGADAPGAGDYLSQSTYWLLFDAHVPCILDSVTVMSMIGGDRTFALIDPYGAVLQAVTVPLDTGLNRVELGFAVPAQEGLGLRCLDDFAYLWRDGLQSTLAFPYEVGDLVTIHSNSLDHPLNKTRYYYFFYDWKVRVAGVACTSERVATTVRARFEGCTYPAAFNFLVEATEDDGSCLWLGCTDEDALNYHPMADLDNGSCIFSDGAGAPCPSDLDGDAAVGVTDLLVVLSDFGTACSN